MTRQAFDLVPLQLALFFMLLSVVLSIAAAETGPLEKGALFLLGAALLWLASHLRPDTYAARLLT